MKNGGGLTRILPLPHWQISCNKFDKMRQIFDLFWIKFLPSHTVWDRMVIKRWNAAEKNRRANIYAFYEAVDTLRILFFRYLGQNRFSFLKMPWGPDLGQVDWEIVWKMKMTAMARFMYNLWSNMYPNWLTLKGINNKRFFWTGPPCPHIKKTSNLSYERFKDI